MSELEKPQAEHLRCRIIIEVLGKPKEHIEKALRSYVKKIRDDGNFIVLKEEFSGAAQQESVYSIFVELEMIIKGVSNLIGFCFDYMPSSVEILKPDHLSMTNLDLANIINDLQAKLHNVDMVAKQLRGENDLLRKNLHASLTNTVKILLNRRGMAPEELARFMGLPEKEADELLGKLVEQNHIKKEDNKFKLA